METHLPVHVVSSQTRPGLTTVPPTANQKTSFQSHPLPTVALQTPMPTSAPQQTVVKSYAQPSIMAQQTPMQIGAQQQTIPVQVTVVPASAIPQSYVLQPYQQAVGHQQAMIRSDNIRFQALRVECPHCGETVVTRLVKSLKVGFFVLSLALFICTFVLFFWIPLIIDSCYDVLHVCPNCKEIIIRKE